MTANELEVWVVDDDQSVRWVLEKALCQAGMSTRCFERAEHLLDLGERVFGVGVAGEAGHRLSHRDGRVGHRADDG